MKRATMTVDVSEARIDGEYLIIDDYGTKKKRVRIELSLFMASYLVEKLALYARLKRDRAIEALNEMKGEVSK